jgi:PAS fold
LDLMDEAVVVQDKESSVMLWNRAASSITGYSKDDLIYRRCPEGLFHIDEQHDRAIASSRGVGTSSKSLRFAPTPGISSARLPVFDSESNEETHESLQLPTLVSLTHKLGHIVPAMLRRLPLPYPDGTNSGSVMLFYPVEQFDALLHGECEEGAGIDTLQSVLHRTQQAMYTSQCGGGSQVTDAGGTQCSQS